MYFTKVIVSNDLARTVSKALDTTSYKPKQKITLQFCFENQKNYIKRIFIVSPQGRVVKSYKGANSTYPWYGKYDEIEDVVIDKTFLPPKYNEITWNAQIGLLVQEIVFIQSKNRSKLDDE